jgi:hypothetical protein
MIYLSITQIDAVTGIICTAEPMRTGPSYPQIKGCEIIWCNKSTWPIATTSEGAHTVAPLFFGYCDDDADLNVSGVVSTYSFEEYQTLKNVEHQARKPYPSWIGNQEEMTWSAPVSMPIDATVNGGNVYYQWNESTISWIENTFSVAP